MSIKVMIVDDEPHVIHIIKQYLERRGLDVVTAANGKYALELFEKNRVDIIITDVQMPVMTGQDLCEKLMQLYAQDLPQIFVMTSRTDKQLRTWAKLFPKIEFLEKPLSLRRLNIKINEFIQAKNHD